MRKAIILLGSIVGVGLSAQTGSCIAGTTRLGTDGVFYGCVSTDKWVRISEPTATTAVVMSEGNGTVKMANGSLHIKENGAVHQLKNANFIPIDIAGQIHAVGKTIYTNNHFYEGVYGGKWHKIDNDVVTIEGEGYEALMINIVVAFRRDRDGNYEHHDLANTILNQNLILDIVVI